MCISVNHSGVLALFSVFMDDLVGLSLELLGTLEGDTLLQGALEIVEQVHTVVVESILLSV